MGSCPASTVYRLKRNNASPCTSSATGQPACGTSSRAPRPSPLSGPTWSTPSTRRGTGRTQVKLVWTLIRGRIAPAVFTHVPASNWGAMAGMSPHEAILPEDTALDMNPCENFVASLNVQGAFPQALNRCLTGEI